MTTEAVGQAFEDASNAVNEVPPEEHEMAGDVIETTLQLRLGPVLAMRQNIRDHAFTFAHPACVEYERLYDLLTDDERAILPLADPQPLPPIEGRSIHPAYAS